ncbi:Hypothetical predicted protein [Octopus vulgaris]|uniref:Uncharacterized protein n=1 Tax=Octopus vulgaris TaxID=6645 RepID=A0AA36AZ72_OCTVU|nr:Hypothetical predicted protein [Octopus vulgaris]
MQVKSAEITSSKPFTINAVDFGIDERFAIECFRFGSQRNVQKIVIVAKMIYSRRLIEFEKCAESDNNTDCKAHFHLFYTMNCGVAPSIIN